MFNSESTDFWFLKTILRFKREELLGEMGLSQGKCNMSLECLGVLESKKVSLKKKKKKVRKEKIKWAYPKDIRKKPEGAVND